MRPDSGPIQVEARQAAEPEPDQQHRRPEGEALHGDRQEEQAPQPEPGRSISSKFGDIPRKRSIGKPTQGCRTSYLKAY